MDCFILLHSLIAWKFAAVPKRAPGAASMNALRIVARRSLRPTGPSLRSCATVPYQGRWQTMQTSILKDPRRDLLMPVQVASWGKRSLPSRNAGLPSVTTSFMWVALAKCTKHGECCLVERLEGFANMSLIRVVARDSRLVVPTNRGMSTRSH